MIRLKTYKYGYFKILLLIFSINIVLQPCLGQDLNVSTPDGESDQELPLPALEKPDPLFLTQPEESDSLSQAQPDSTDNDKVLKNRNITLSKALNYLDNHFYSIAGVVISVYFIFSQDEDKDASVSKVGPPPDWPNN